MTIRDVKEELLSILTEIAITGGSMVTSIYKDELKMAIETMSKFQKIEELAKREDLDAVDILRQIREVIEDGKGKVD